SLRHVSGIEDDMEKGVNALCAVARPERFIDTLESHGFRVVNERLLPDHDDLRGRDLFAGMDLSLPLIVTEKDWMKLRKRGDMMATSVYVAAYDVTIEPRDAFRTWLRDRLDVVKK
ncbi:MAG TPA: tetraacyldisaccharide 4'-kinase, partial [Fimbriimonadaceae bacterium]|nr:tetraacyldisaccharide 4'-kinase [Fimbriimonadaceae bacterium]